MQRFLFLIVTFFLFLGNSFAQKIGEWRSHYSYESNITAIARGEEKIYAVSDGKLFSYDPEDDSYQTYAKPGESDILKIAYNKKQKGLLIVRQNGDIDVLYNQSDYINIPDLKNVMENIDKITNDVYINEGLAYLSTNFGLIVVNMEKHEVKETLMLRYPVYSTCLYNGNLYIATSNGVKTINAKDNIQNIGGWSNFSLENKHLDSSNKFTDKEIRQLRDFDGKLTFIVPNKGLYVYDSNTVTRRSAVAAPQVMTYGNSGLLVSGTTNIAEILSLSNGTQDRIINIASNAIAQDSQNTNTYWVGIPNKNMGKVEFNPSDNTFTVAKEYIKAAGPLSNYPFYLSYESGKLLFTGGGAITNNFNYPGRLSEYINDSWYNYDVSEVVAVADRSVIDYMSAVTDPSDPEHIYVCSWFYGLLEFKDKKFVQSYTENNSALMPDKAGSKMVRVGGATYDKKGNLWLLNASYDDPVKVMKAGTNTITELKYNSIYRRFPTLRTIMVDRYNRKWIVGIGQENYLFIIDDNNTPDVASDDKTKFVDYLNFTTQDGTKVTGGQIAFFSLVEDKTGNIWAGTTAGVFVIYNSSNIIESNRDIVFNKIKVPRNDGSNIVDVLLEDISVTAIGVDGANRKWLGTASSGLYVVSSNGYETVHHFTTENSLLPSNNILSVAMDNEHGIVYIGTEKGIVSYRNEAVDGAEKYSNVYVYPNPVEPDYDGAITITGLKANSTVKITDVKGNLINEGKSLGGQYIWNGRNRGHERVETGVYLIFGSSEDGKDGVVSKVMVITN